MQNIEKTPIGHLLVGGGKRKVIALHSWMDDAESWSTTIPFIDQTKFTYAFMDVRGYGKSKHLKGTYTSDEIAHDVFNLADDLGWDNFYLIGHSMCGMAAQKAALLDKANRIIKIMLVTPVSAAGFPADEQTKIFLNALVQNEDVAKMGYDTFTSNRLSDNWKTMRAKRHIAVTDRDAQIGYMNMWLNENFLEAMRTVTKPFLVLAGQYDHPEFRLDVQKQAFADFLNVELLEIENAGHFPMQETPVFLATTIESFFS
ncbi:MAG: alpha/beta fold hydrolase [Bacteroidetes bacterium]|nr:alpha/beta fold hydrolase [Bacteroidota bacterium]